MDAEEPPPNIMNRKPISEEDMDSWRYQYCKTDEERKLVKELLTINGEGRTSILEEAEKAYTFGETCDYAGTSSSLACPGLDGNCRESKTNGCKLYNGFEKRGGILQYFDDQVKILENNGHKRDVSYLKKMIKEAHDLYRKEDFFHANIKLKHINSGLEKELKISEKESEAVLLS